jgi:hypothetical protein
MPATGSAPIMFASSSDEKGGAMTDYAAKANGQGVLLEWKGHG